MTMAKVLLSGELKTNMRLRVQQENGFNLGFFLRSPDLKSMAALAANFDDLINLSENSHS